MSQDAAPITVSDWIAAQARTKRLLWVLTLGAFAVALGLCMLAIIVADAVTTGAARWPLTATLIRSGDVHSQSGRRSSPEVSRTRPIGWSAG